jgi:hypothetical protein
MYEHFSPQAAAGHNSGPPQQTYYRGSGLLMDYPLKNCVAVFWGGFNKASFILGNWTFLRIPESKRKKL